MKVRKEKSGLHFFDRTSGLHMLLDEIKIPVQETSVAPRSVSIALTNICDLKCHFCYAPKNRNYLEFHYLTELCQELDKLGVLEITFGGGEPTLHPQFVELCTWIWDNTGLGISFTTHGHHIDEEFVKQITGKVSCIRFSIDGVEPRYSQIRGKSLDNLMDKISLIKGAIPFGINCVVSKGQTAELFKVIELSIAVHADNVLIIPEHENGQFQITKNDWAAIDKIIKDYDNDIELLVTYDASEFLDADTLEVAVENELLFAHISADNKLKINSFDTEGLIIERLENLKHCFETLNLS